MSSVVVTVVGIVQLAVLTRLLDRADFGLMAMVTTVVGFAQVFADMGVSNAIIYRQDATRRQLSSLYWTNLIAGAVLYGVIVAVSPVVSHFFRQPELRSLLVWAGLVFLITPWGQQFQVLLQKDLVFRTLAFVEVGSAATGMAVAIGAAVAGAGVYALVWGVLAQALARATSLAVQGWRTWRPHLHLAWGDLRGFIGFGLYQMGERAIYYWAANIDYLLIGRFLGPEQLGIYSIAYGLVVLPLSKINPILTRVAFPVFARRQHDDAALRRGFGELLTLVSAVTFPLLVGLAATASVAIPVLFGSQWEPSVVLVQILVVMALFKCVSNPTGSLFLAKGRADFGFWINVAQTAVTMVALYLVVGEGVRAVAWGHVGVQAGFFFVEYWLIRRICGLRFGAYLRSLADPTGFALAMGAAVYALLLVLHPRVASEVVVFVAVVTAGVAVYAGLWLVLRRAYVGELWRLLVSRGEAA